MPKPDNTSQFAPLGAVAMSLTADEADGQEAFEMIATMLADMTAKEAECAHARANILPRVPAHRRAMLAHHIDQTEANIAKVRDALTALAGHLEDFDALLDRIAARIDRKGN